MGFSLIRMKTMAILLGPAGLGLMSLYGSVADLAVGMAGLGVQQSGVRQIAEASSSRDEARIANTVTALKTTSLILGMLGALGMALLCVPISYLTFGSPDYAIPVALLGIVVLLRLFIGGETSLVQGTRRLADLARLNIFGAFASVVVTVPMLFLWGEAAIVPSLILVTLTGAAVAWWYGRKVPVAAAPVSGERLRRETWQLLRLGFAFLVSAFLTMGAAYAVRIIVLHTGDVLAAGLYQAAWAVSGLYIGFVLQAMGTDFYPRLTGVATDNEAITRLVNEQTQVSLLLAGPGVIGTIVLAPLAMAVFYSHDFAAAAGPLRWLCLGMMLRVVSWPMGFIIIAKGWQKTFIAVEIVATILHVGLAALLVPQFGVDGACIAFFGLYVFHTVLVYIIVWIACEFRWSATNLNLLALFIPMTALSFTGFIVLPFWEATWLGLVVTALSCLYSLFHLANMASEMLPKPIQRALEAVLRRLPQAKPNTP
jgi:antigen flippase